MKAIVKLAMKVAKVCHSVRAAFGQWRTTIAINRAVRRNSIHISELENLSLRTFSCLPDSLESGSVCLSAPPAFYRDPGAFLSSQVGGYGQTPKNKKWVLLCLAEDWTADCWGAYKDLGALAPAVFFAKQDGTWSVDPYGEWRDGLSPGEFVRMSEFTLKVRAGFPNMGDVGWDEI